MWNNEKELKVNLWEAAVHLKHSWKIAVNNL